MARSVADVEFLDAIINDCHSKRKDVEMNGLRIGYPREWWADLSDEVQCLTILKSHKSVHLLQQL